MAIYKVLMEKGTKIITDSLNAVKSQVSVLTASVSRNTSDIPATIEGASIYNTTYIEGNKVIGGTAGEYHDTLTIKDADGNVLLTHLKVAPSVPHHGGSVN